MRSAEPVPSAATNTWKPSARKRVEPAAERVGVADDGIERARGEHRRVGIVGRVEHRHGLRLGVREQPVERQRQARRVVGVERRAPRLRERLARARPPRRAAPARGRAGGGARTARRARSRAAGRAAGARRRSATAATTPCRRTSGPPRAAPTARAPHGCVCEQLGARGRAPRRSAAARAPGRSTRRSTSTGRALVGDRELREPVDLVAPEVDAHGMVGGRRVDVDDRAAHRDLAARLDLVLAPVAHRDEPVDELVAVELRRPA